jgi:2-hydroxy-6-oxonona-2,4-dienedioate hydrolase
MGELTYENTLRELHTDEGRDDRVSPVDMALLPLRTLPRGEIHIFPDCGHWVMIEQKAAWESAALAFLTRPE